MWLCSCENTQVSESHLEIATGAQPEEETKDVAEKAQENAHPEPKKVEGSKPADDCRNDVEASGGVGTSQKAASKNDGLISKIESGKWEVIHKDDGIMMEYLPSKYIPGGATYRARATIDLPMSVEDALLCFMDFSPNKLHYARDYKDLKIDQVVRCTGMLPGKLPEESIVVATLNFEGFLWYLKPFLPSSVTLRCTIEEDPSCPGRYDWSQQTLGTDGKPDGRNKKAGSIQAHPSGDAGRCMISSLSEVPSWLPVWVMKYAAPKTKTYLGEYTGRYLAYKKQSTSA